MGIRSFAPAAVDDIGTFVQIVFIIIIILEISTKEAQVFMFIEQTKLPCHVKLHSINFCYPYITVTRNSTSIIFTYKIII